MRGVYRIVNKINGKCYVGRSDNIFTRCHQHFTLLHNRRHPSEDLQKDFDEIGITNFTFEIVERCNLGVIKQREVHYMREFDSVANGYNAGEPTHGLAPILFTTEKKEELIKKAFTKANPGLKLDPCFVYLYEACLKDMLPIFDDKIEMLRAENEILVLPNEFSKYRNVPFIFLEKDLEQQ